MKQIILLLLLVLAPLSLQAQDAKVEWDENEDADYYILYWGEEAWGEDTNKYSNKSEKLTECSFIIKDLPRREFFFSVEAFNFCGNSSGPSPTTSNCDSKKDVAPQTQPRVTNILNVNVTVELP